MTDRELLEHISARLAGVESSVTTLLSIMTESRRSALENDAKIREELQKQMEQFPPEFRGMLAPLVDFHNG